MIQNVKHLSLDFPGYWRIVWFGKLMHSPLHAYKPQKILTYLRKLPESTNQADQNLAPVGTLQMTYIDIGELAKLHIGTITKNGTPIDNSAGKFHYEKIQSAKLDFTESNLIVFDRYHQVDGKYIIPEGKQQVESEGDNNNLFVGIEANGNPYHFVIPCTEVFRFFYATSSTMAKVSLSDKFLSPDKHLWDTKASKRGDPPEAYALIWLRKRMLDSDAPYLARFPWDPYALNKAKDIYLYAAALKLPNHERMIFAKPPIQGSHKTKFVSVDLSSGSILISRLISCDWVPEYTYLKWDRDNDGRSNPDENTFGDPPKAGWPSKPKPKNLLPPDFLGGDRHNPDLMPSKITESEIEDRFPKLKEIPKKKMPQPPTGPWKAPEDMNSYYKNAFGGTTQDGQSSESVLGATTIESEMQSAGSTEAEDVDVKTGISDYLSVLKHLQLANGIGYVEFSEIVVTEFYKKFEGVHFNVFPATYENKKHNWLYIDEEKK